MSERLWVCDFAGDLEFGLVMFDLNKIKHSIVEY